MTSLVAPIAVPTVGDHYHAMVVAYADDTNISFWASLLIVPVVASAIEGADPDTVIPGAGAPAVLS